MNNEKRLQSPRTRRWISPPGEVYCAKLRGIDERTLVSKIVSKNRVDRGEFSGLERTAHEPESSEIVEP